MTTVNAPYSYYNTLNPNNQLSQPKASTSNIFGDKNVDVTPNQDTSSSSSSSSNSADGSSSTNNGLPQLPSNLVTLLQAFAPGNAASQTVGLVGGAEDSLTGNSEFNLINANFVKSLTTAIAKVSQTGSNAPATQPATVQNFLTSRHAALNAYNTTLLNQAKTVLQDNSDLTA